VKLYEKLQLIAASVERLKAIHPAALLTKLSRMLSILNVFQKEFAQLVLLFSWIHQIAQLLQPLTNSEEAESQLVAFVEELKQSGLPTEMMSLVIYMEKITIAFAPHLFEYVKQPL
jgi:exonuclease V gamma subunit